MSKKIEILIDANSMVLRSGDTHLNGISRTTFELASALDVIDKENLNITLITQTFRGKLPARFSSLKVCNIYWPIGRKYDWLRDKTPLFDWLVKHDLQHIPHNYGPVFRPDKMVVTIHDAMFFSHPENFLNHDFSRHYVPKIAKAARAIVTCSQNSKADIVEYMKIVPEKVTVIPWGINRTLFFKRDKIKLRKQLAEEKKLRRPFYLAVSCNVGRKNTISVLRAYKAALNKSLEHDLVVLWSKPPPDLVNEFIKEIERGRIVFLKNTNDFLLAKLYAAATITWFPSKYEGFGLPILESMACGTPVVTCQNSSLAEIGGSAAIYVQPEDISMMADIMKYYDTNSTEEYELLCKSSIKQTKKFCWKKTASRYINLYQTNC